MFSLFREKHELSICPGRSIEVKRNFLHSCRGLCCGRNEAWADCFDWWIPCGCLYCSAVSHLWKNEGVCPSPATVSLPSHTASVSVPVFLVSVHSTFFLLLKLIEPPILERLMVEGLQADHCVTLFGILSESFLGPVGKENPGFEVSVIFEKFDHNVLLN